MKRVSAQLKRIDAAAGGDLSEHFSKVEFACHCCGELEINDALIDALEELRTLAGEEIFVHDGYRCQKHNELVGGVPNSEHMQGIAADIVIHGLSLQQMYELALQVPRIRTGGIGVYDGGFIHVDVRPHPARWARVRGQYVGIQHLVTMPTTLIAQSKNGPQPV